MDGNALKIELMKDAKLVDGVGKHWAVNPVKVAVTVLIGKDKEPVTQVVTVQKLWTNCFEAAGNVFKPWWTIVKAEFV